jgi:hypothetical protein
MCLCIIELSRVKLLAWTLMEWTIVIQSAWYSWSMALPVLCLLWSVVHLLSIMVLLIEWDGTTFGIGDQSMVAENRTDSWSQAIKVLWLGFGSRRLLIGFGGLIGVWRINCRLNSNIVPTLSVTQENSCQGPNYCGPVYIPNTTPWVL